MGWVGSLLAAAAAFAGLGLLLEHRARAQPAPSPGRRDDDKLPRHWWQPPTAVSPSPVYPSGVPHMDSDYSLQTFRPIIARLIPLVAPRTPQAFAEKWGEIESGWNPCAVGDPGQLGPDGNPAEIGIGQLYNPDDFVAMGARAADFRAYCPAAAPLAAAYKQAQQAGDHAAMAQIARQMQTKTRALTPDELDAQIRVTLLDKIQQGIIHADAVVHQYGLSGWSVPDYWKLVKAPHALPAILGNGLPAVVKKLGRAPRSWAEFRQVLGMDGNSQWKRALDACEACGNAVQLATS